MRISQAVADLVERYYWKEAVGRIFNAKTQKNKDILIGQLQDQIRDLKRVIERKDMYIAARWRQDGISWGQDGKDAV